MSKLTRLGLPFAALALFIACGGDDDGGGGNCPQLSGSWSSDGSGTCPASSCTVTQNGCSVQVNCDDGTRLSGKVGSGSGESVSVSLSTNGGRCTGFVEDLRPGEAPQIDVQCNIDGSSCDAKLDCDEGTCTSAGENRGGGDGPVGGAGGAGGGAGGGGAGGGASGGGNECCDAADSCGYANDDFCDCPEQRWDAADCGGGSGGGGSGGGGSGGGGNEPTLEEFCSLAVNGLCTCFEGTDAACTQDDAQLFYDGCVAGISEAAFIACYGNYVDAAAGTVDCVTAAEVCLVD